MPTTGAFSHFVFVDDEGNQIGIFCDENASFCTEQEKAYAKLFAAAPEMYDLLKQLYGVLANVPVLQVEIEKVLKKARGE